MALHLSGRRDVERPVAGRASATVEHDPAPAGEADLADRWVQLGSCVNAILSSVTVH